jgi:hypothetical protein
VSSTVANSSTTPVITLNIPSASATARGLVTTGAQTIAGAQTFNSDIIVNGVSVGVGPNSTLTTNTVLGKNALANSATSDLNTAIGYNVLTVNGATAFGNTGVGTEALKSNTSGQRNTGIGESAMRSNTTGNSNTAVGEFASRDNSVGSDNTSVGNFALAANIGSKNTAIGSGANTASTTLENTTAIGYGSTVSASNTIQLGNTDIANVKTSGTITAGNVTYPKLDGSNGQVLVTNGSGVATFKTMDLAGTNLTDGKILVGNASNIATAVNVSGDITMTNAGVASIAAGAVVTADLAAAAVSYAKIQNMNSKTLIGNKSLTAGVPGEITLGTGLALNETTGVLSASGSGGTVTGTGTAGQLPYWSSTSGLGGNPNFTWDNTNKIAKIGEGVNHAGVDSYPTTLMSTMPVLSVIGKVNDVNEQTLLRLKRVHNHGSSYEGVFDFVSSGGSGNKAQLDIRLNSSDNVNYKNLLSLENQNGNVGINNTAPSEKLDVAGNIKFSGVLKPNNLAGTAGQVLTSQGASTAPTWVTPSSGIGGSGTASYIPKFNASTTTLGNSKLFDDGTSVFVNSIDGSGGNKFVVNSGARTLPATTGATQSGGAIRIGGSSNDVMDMGIGTLNGWIQVADKVSLATKYALLLNPNGGNVGIGVTSATSTLHVNGNVKASSFNDLIVKSNGSNVVLGQGNVLALLTTGENNIAVGQYTLNYLDAGSANLGMGYSAMYNTRGSSNVGLGHEALWTNNTGNYNTAVGHTAGRANTGSNNTFLGFESNSTGSLTNATAIGNGANVTTSNTIQLGNSAVTNVKTSGTITAGVITYPSVAGTNGYVLTTNGSNTATWAAAATGIGGSGTASYIPKFNASTTTLGNSKLFDDGTSVMINETTTALAGGAALLVSDGVNAAPVTTGTTQTGGALRIRGGDNTVIDFGTVSTKPWIQAGDLAGLGTNYPLYINPNGGTVAIGLGTASATSTSKLQVNGDVGATTFNNLAVKKVGTSIALGSGAPSVTGNDNISIGEGTLNSLTTAGQNIAIGYRSMYKTNTEENTAVGYMSMFENTGGRYNTAIGFKAGYDNTYDYNTFIGYSANSIGSITNATAIGNGAVVSTSNTMQLGNANVTSVKTSGAISAPIYSSSPVALTAGTTITWAPMSGLNASVTLNANSTLSFGANAPPAGSSGTLIVTQPASGGPYTLALPASVTNKVLGSSSGITLSSAANARDIVSFYYDGSSYYWNVGLGYGSAQSLSANSLTGGVAGAIPYQTATNTTGFTDAGTAGYYLTSQGAGKPTWTAPTTGIGGSGTASYIPRFNGSTTTLGNSLIFDNGTSIGINTASPSSSFKLDVNGAANFTNDIVVNGMKIGLGNGAISSNIMLGNFEVGYANSTGSNLTAIGTGSFRYNTTGNNNVGVGYWALRNNSTGSRNVAIGDNSLTTNTTGTNITAIGYGANSADGLTNATAIGNGANVSTSNTIQLGNGSVTDVKTSGMLTASSITAPTINGASIKLGAGSIASNIVLGGNTNTFKDNSSGAENFIFGNNAAMANTSGSYNIAMGQEAFRYNTTGSQSIGLGAYALRYNTTGNYNVAIGYNALLNNVTGSYLTAIGYGANSADGLTNATAIGNGANVTTSNTIQLGNSSVTNVKTSGTITAGAITYPSVAGTNGYVLTTNGSNTASWAAPSFVDLSSAQTIGGIKTFSAASTVVNNNLTVNSAGTVGQGITLSDDGDFVDNNDGFGTFRFTGGIKINSNKGALGTATNITLSSGGSITATGAITAPSIKLTTGASNGYILTSAADGTASWAASSSSISGGTTNALPKYSSATAITSSSISDDGTTVTINNPVSFNNKTIAGGSAAVNAQTGLTYTLLQSDNGKVITINNASANTLTLPTSLTAGFNCMIVQYGAGTVTIVGASGVTVVNRSNYNKTGGQYAIVTIVSPVANTFITGGDMQ